MIIYDIFLLSLQKPYLPYLPSYDFGSQLNYIRVSCQYIIPMLALLVCTEILLLLLQYTTTMKMKKTANLIIVLFFRDI